MKIFRWKRAGRISLLDKTPERTNDVIWRNVEGEAAVVVLNMASGKFYIFKDKEAEIWKLCDGKRTCQQILSIMKKSQGTRERDIIKFINESLVENKLIRLR